MRSRIMRRVIMLTVIAGLLVSATIALAQTGYELGWWTADGGGGTSSSSGYTLSGTLGQADAGTLSGGGYTLIGGFWGGTALNYNIYLPLVVR